MGERSPASGYRIIDELEGACTPEAKPPWPPVGLFFLTILFAPIGAMLFGINWSRFNFPERRYPAFAAAVVALFLPFIVVFGASAADLPMDRDILRPVVSLYTFAVALWQYQGQKMRYESYLARGGERASTWPLWVWAVTSVLILIGTVVISRRI